MRIIHAGSLEVDAEACRELWRRVIAQAVDEAQRGGETGAAAWRWIFAAHNDEDFRQVCEYAGVEPDAVRDRVRAMTQKEVA